MKTVAGVMMVLGFVSLPALADTYVLDSSLSGRDDIDWTVASSYSGSHSRNPATGDLVEIPAGMVAKVVAGSGSWEMENCCPCGEMNYGNLKGENDDEKT